MAKKKKQFARERASELLQRSTMTLGPEGRTYQLHDKDTGELVTDPLVGVDVDAGLFSRNRRQNKLIGKELMRQRALLPREQAVKAAEEAKSSSFVPEKLPEFKFDPGSYRGVTLGKSTQTTGTTNPVSTETQSATPVTTTTPTTTPQQDNTVESNQQNGTKEKLTIGDIDLSSSFMPLTTKEHGLMLVPRELDEYSPSPEEVKVNEENARQANLRKQLGINFNVGEHAGAMDEFIGKHLSRDPSARYNYLKRDTKTYGESLEDRRKWYYDKYPGSAKIRLEKLQSRRQ